LKHKLTTSLKAIASQYLVMIVIKSNYTSTAYTEWTETNKNLRYVILYHRNRVTVHAVKRQKSKSNSFWFQTRLCICV